MLQIHTILAATSYGCVDLSTRSHHTHSLPAWVAHLAQRSGQHCIEGAQLAYTF
jgi:hypothetical protein